MVIIGGDTGSVSGDTLNFLAASVGPTVAFSGASTTLTLGFADAGNNVLIAPGTTGWSNGGSVDVGLGYQAFNGSSSGGGNMAFGYQAGAGQSGSFNAFIGYQAGSSAWNGQYSVFLGYQAGSASLGGDTANIYINSPGVGGESNTVRIGAGTGTGTQQLNSAYIGGIYGVTTTSGTVLPVLVSDGDQLGTMASSIRFKEHVRSMGDSSSAVMGLRPVTFNFKKHPASAIQYGLIAEEVYELFPDLVNLDDEGKPFSVKYHDLPAILLNELKKMADKVADLEAKLAAQG